MIRIEYPKHPFRIKRENGIEMIFDECRKLWVILTPEEWVRQNFIQYLTTTMKYPSKLIAVEKEIQLGELKKRCDAVVYRRNGLPWMIIECKEMNTAIDDGVMAQVLRYHISLPAQYLVVTNGRFCFGFEKKDGRFRDIEKLPEFV